MTAKTPRLTAKGVFSLFLVCVFPIHFWAIIILLSDVQWVAERTHTWDAIGYTAYVLLIALVESFGIFLLVLLLSFLLPKRFGSNKTIGVMSLYVLVVVAWAILNQLNFFPPDSFNHHLDNFIASSQHPLRWEVLIMGLVLIFVLVSTIAPVVVMERSADFVRRVNNWIEKISMLSIFYLILDGLGLIIIIFRNLAPAL